MTSEGQLTPMTVVAWNVCGGGGQRISRVIRALSDLNASVVVLAEVTQRRLAEWEGALADLGLAHQAHRMDATTDDDPYGVFIASTEPLEPHAWPMDAPCPNRAVRVRIGTVSIAGIHAPDQAKPGRSFLEWLLAAAHPALGESALMIGDFNADSDGNRLPLNRWFAPLVESGWDSAISESAPDTDHSTFWSGSDGLAIDHALVSASLRARLGEAAVLDSIGGTRTAGPGFLVRDGALSDHRPLLVRFK